MGFGVVFPTTQIGTDPAVIRDFAQTAEGLGYCRLLAYDHVLGAVHADRDPPLPGNRIDVIRDEPLRYLPSLIVRGLVELPVKVRRRPQPRP
jgi:hypothetical protein